jgi:voltage-gated potassium channel
MAGRGCGLARPKGPTARRGWNDGAYDRLAMTSPDGRLAARRAVRPRRGPQVGRHVRLWLGAVVATVVIGTLGYIVLLGWDLSDALYMTVISLTTTGYREVQPLDDLGRAWTGLVSIAGVAIIFGTVGIVAETVLSEFGSGRREARRMQETVSALSGHFVVCGYGRVGGTVARELVHAGYRPVVIDVLAASIDRARADGHLVVEGDATQDATLVSAGVLKARCLITTIDSDANNVYVTLSARALNPGLFIVARANLEGSDAKLAQAGADRVVSPYTRAGRQIAELAIRPRVADYIDAALSHGELAFSIEELTVVAGGPLVGRSVGELRDLGVFALAIVRGERDYVANPPTDHHLGEGETIIATGSVQTLRAIAARA